jgi:hypothetical protein
VGLCLGSASAMAQNISDGTFISGSYYDGGAAPTTTGSFSSPACSTSCPGISYTNGAQSQSAIISDPSFPFAGAAASANLSTDQLVLVTTGSEGTTQARAEMWDTLNLSNLPSGPSISNSTVLGELTMTVNTSAGTATTPIMANSAFGIQIFNTNTFVQSTQGADCGTIGGLFIINPCNASLYYQSSNGGSVQANGSVYGGAITNANANHSYTFQVPITFLEAVDGPLSYIAEVAVTNSTGDSLTSPLLVDPSVSFSSDFAGLTLSSTSGINYESPPSPVPVPATAWLFGSGLLAVFWASRRRLLPL